MKNKFLITFVFTVAVSVLVYQQWSQLQAANESQSATNATLDYALTGASEAQ
ncbi:MAG: hypothetical protein MUF87_15410 [Anaerolineae bacterium]|jgi:hypothetical protein|nr:hypothetical protein [Anaerolineae bacterium]